jgi:hypothetical protein
MYRPESPAQFPHLFVIKAVSEPDTPSEIGQIFLLVRPHELLKCEMDDFPFRARTRCRNGFLNQILVQHDIGSHASSMVYLEVYCTHHDCIHLNMKKAAPMARPSK